MYQKKKRVVLKALKNQSKLKLARKSQKLKIVKLSLQAMNKNRKGRQKQAVKQNYKKRQMAQNRPRPAEPSNEDINFCKCPLCHQKFPSSDIALHYNSLCGKMTIQCPSCAIKVERQTLSEHIEHCCFRKCFKCKQNIYGPAFAYHLKHCQNPHNRLIRDCKHLPRANPEASLMIPCSLILV